MEELEGTEIDSNVRHPSETPWPEAFLKLVRPSLEKETPGRRKAQAEQNNKSFDLVFGKVFMPKTESGIYRDPGLVNPFLKQHELDFYGAHVSLALQDRARVLESELIKDY